MRVILRFPDLVKYRVNNWVTLGRWIKEQGAPAGFYLGYNTRCWFQDDWETWVSDRAEAGIRRAGAPPPDKAKPGPCVSPQETGRIESNSPQDIANQKRLAKPRMGGLAHE